MDVERQLDVVGFEGLQLCLPFRRLDFLVFFTDSLRVFKDLVLAAALAFVHGVDLSAFLFDVFELGQEVQVVFLDLVLAFYSSSMVCMVRDSLQNGCWYWE